MSAEAVPTRETASGAHSMRTLPGLTLTTARSMWLWPLPVLPAPRAWLGRANVDKAERYAKLAVRQARVVEQINGQWLATIEGFPGVWACEDSVVEALSVLEEVVADWTRLKVEDGDDDLPRLEDIHHNIV